MEKVGYLVRRWRWGENISLRLIQVVAELVVLDGVEVDVDDSVRDKLIEVARIVSSCGIGDDGVWRVLQDRGYMACDVCGVVDSVLGCRLRNREGEEFVLCDEDDGIVVYKVNGGR